MRQIGESFQAPPEFFSSMQSATHVAVLTGSGVSAESGVPTFREAQTGLWAQYDPESLATPEAFRRDPALVWQWYRWRRELIGKAKPNPGHLSLVEMEALIRGYSLITQNVDGLHRLAGSSAVIELHGNIMRTRCTRDGRIIKETSDSSDNLPHCPDCGSLLRPDVVWFGEALPRGSYHEALIAARTCDIFFSIGTSGVVQPAASLALEARATGAIIVEINIDDTPLTQFSDFVFRGTAGNILPSLVNSIKGR